MNSHDKDNLNFLLHSSRDTIALWLKQADADDIKYAKELLVSAEMELVMLNKNEVLLDFTLANSVLSKFRV
jgi:hypothetical protein